MAPSTLPLESSPLLFNKHFNLICICSIQVFPYPACVFLLSGCCLLFWLRDTSEHFPSAPHSELAGTRAEFLKQASRKMIKWTKWARMSGYSWDVERQQQQPWNWSSWLKWATSPASLPTRSLEIPWAGQRDYTFGLLNVIHNCDFQAPQ